MSRLIAACLASAVFVITSGCSQPVGAESSGTDRPALNIISTGFPGYDFARAVAGERAGVSILLPPGAESHSFEPTPQDIIAIENCDLFIYVGGESENWVKEILGAMDTSGITLLAMMDHVDVVTEEHKDGMEEEAADEAQAHAGEADPDQHVWTSPRNAMRITQAVADVLCRQDAAHTDEYRQNCAAYVERLEDIDARFREITTGARRKTLVFGDRFPMRYFTKEYGLDYYAAFPACSTESEASARTVGFLIDKVNEEGIPVVFCIEFSSGRTADIICEATGAEKRLLHSCHNVTRDELQSGVTYADLMEANAAVLREALY